MGIEPAASGLLDQRHSRSDNQAPQVHGTKIWVMVLYEPPSLNPIPCNLSQLRWAGVWIYYAISKYR